MRLRQFIEDESGATAVEYALIATLMSVVIISSLTTLGRAIERQFETIAEAIAAPQP
jgi:pilus assembly protein Flp/PilA